MKVVLFCGGQGLRIRDYSEHVPKPMVPIGSLPVLMHLMKFYAHYGHREFILCLGYQADVIKRFFLNYSAAIANDFVLTNGGRDIQLLGGGDDHDWKITFVDTGMHTPVGGRLWRVREHLVGEEMFLANYADVLSDAPLDRIVEDFRRSDAVASMLAVPANQTFHIVQTEGDAVARLEDVVRAGLRINGGFFCLRREIFEYMRENEDLVGGAFDRLIAARKLSAVRYDGFWAPMDTLREKQRLEELHATGEAPWLVWGRRAAA